MGPIREVDRTDQGNLIVVNNRNPPPVRRPDSPSISSDDRMHIAPSQVDYLQLKQTTVSRRYRDNSCTIWRQA